MFTVTKRANNQVFLVTTAERVEEVTWMRKNHSGDWIHRLASIAIIDENQIGKWYHGVPVDVADEIIICSSM